MRRGRVGPVTITMMKKMMRKRRMRWTRSRLVEKRKIELKFIKNMVFNEIYNI